MTPTPSAFPWLEDRIVAGLRCAFSLALIISGVSIIEWCGLQDRVATLPEVPCAAGARTGLFLRMTGNCSSSVCRCQGYSS